MVSHIATVSPQPVSNLTGTPISPSNISVSWTQSIIANGTVVPVSHYIITYFNITCLSEQPFTDDIDGGITINSPLTSTLIPLQSGQLYNISVRASNAVGVSPAVSDTFWTPVSQGMTMSYTSIKITDANVLTTYSSQCLSRNGQCQFSTVILH